MRLLWILTKLRKGQIRKLSHLEYITLKQKGKLFSTELWPRYLLLETIIKDTILTSFRPSLYNFLFLILTPFQVRLLSPHKSKNNGR